MNLKINEKFISNIGRWLIEISYNLNKNLPSSLIAVQVRDAVIAGVGTILSPFQPFLDQLLLSQLSLNHLSLSQLLLYQLSPCQVFLNQLSFHRLMD